MVNNLKIVLHLCFHHQRHTNYILFLLMPGNVHIIFLVRDVSLPHINHIILQGNFLRNSNS